MCQYSLVEHRWHCGCSLILRTPAMFPRTSVNSVGHLYCALYVCDTLHTVSFKDQELATHPFVPKHFLELQRAFRTVGFSSFKIMLTPDMLKPLLINMGVSPVLAFFSSFESLLEGNTPILTNRGLLIRVPQCCEGPQCQC